MLVRHCGANGKPSGRLPARQSWLRNARHRSGSATQSSVERGPWRERRHYRIGTSLLPRRSPYATQEGRAMRLEGERESENIEDRRGIGGFGGGGIPIRVAGGGLGTVALVLLALFFGVDPRAILNGGGDAPQQSQVSERQAPPEAGQDDGPRRFVAQVLATTEDTWTDIFRRANRQYAPPNLVLFSGGTQSACGFAQTAV